MGKAPGTEQSVVDYHISMHLGFCHGPVDSFEEVHFRDRKALVETITSRTSRVIDKPDLFGGPTKEGGVNGRVWFLPGDAAQILPEALSNRLGLEPANCPGFRGVASLFLIGNGYNEKKGMFVGSNMPSVPAVAARIRRGSYTLPTPFPFIPVNGPNDDQGNPTRWVCSNPASMIHECFTGSEDWSLAASPLQFDEGSFLEAAETLFHEGMGMSLRWNRQAPIEDFVLEILDHIQGLFFFNPWTGLGQLRLLRNDYDPNSIPTLGPSDIRITDFKRKLWGETINEIVVSYTNPLSGESETLSYQDLANISIQGDVVSEGRDYHGFLSPELASEVGARDIASATYPYATGEGEADRRQWKFLPGDVFRLHYPAHDIENIIVRVMEVDFGKTGDEKIRFMFNEDIYGLKHAEYIPPPEPEWVDPASVPTPIEGKIVTLPKPIIDGFIEGGWSDDRYPAVVPGILASHADEDVTGFVLNGNYTLQNGDPYFGALGPRRTVGQTELVQNLDAEAVTTGLIVDEVWGGFGPQLAAFALIGDGGEDSAEIVMFDVDEGDGVWTIARGIYDTVPRAWPAGTAIRFLTRSFNAVDLVERVAGQTVQYKLQTVTSLGILPIEAAPTISNTLIPRPYLPFRPANLTVGGVKFGVCDWSELVSHRPDHIPVTWSTRNRNLEDGIARRWGDGPQTPEVGQTTTLILRDLDTDTEIRRISGLVGNQYDVPVEYFGQAEAGSVTAIAERDGMESLQSHSITVLFRPKGYGYDYGRFYGGWTPSDEV